MTGECAPSQPTDAAGALEAQLRRSYGDAVYSYKTHEKRADILQARVRRIKLWQVLLSALTTTGFIGVVFGAGQVGAVSGGIASATLLCLNMYAQSAAFADEAQRHRHAAADIWGVRENLLSLIIDLHGGAASHESVRERRDALITELHAIYSAAPDTDVKAYRRARSALKVSEEATYSEGELDALMPEVLHVADRSSAQAVVSDPGQRDADHSAG